jgi:CDP-6-deoxy-D-xylo-4-hexulose-3-dehydrase
MSEKITWPLAVSTFTWWDKLKISAFLFTEDIWTYGKWVRKYEKMWEDKFDLKHAIMVSSGSTANELIALRRKHELEQAGEWPRKNKVIFPVNTWISSVSVWINFGFEPVFVDVEENTLNVNSKKIKEAFEKNEGVGTVFYTTLLGFFDDVLESKKITENYGARFLLDNCESSFSYYCPKAGSHKSILKLATSSTSIFFSHLTMSGTEGGLIFTESDEEAEWYRMARSHGLTRGMPEKYKNPNVNPDFDFYLLGSNYRSSNLQAYMASLDFERAFDFGEKRQYLFSLFNYSLPEEKYINIFKNVEKDDLGNNMYCPLAIPIVCKTEEGRKRLEIELKKEGVVTRPLIGGCLLAHTAFKKYGNMDDFPVAKKLHNCAIYIGLNKSITKNKIFALLMKIYSI